MLVLFVYKFTTNEAIKVFGIVPVPNTLAPWACLVLFQFIPNVSFFGHLAGIMVGSVHLPPLPQHQAHPLCVPPN